MPIASKTKKQERPPLMVLYMGGGGTGKTTAATSFPQPLVFDGEGGTRHYLNQFDGASIETKSFGQLLKTIRDVKSSGKTSWKEGTETLEFSPKSIVVDPLTAFWDSIQAAKFQEGLDSQGISVSKGTEKPKMAKDTFQAWAAIKTHWKTLMSEAQSSGINFICCAHEKEELKTEVGPNGQTEIVKTGKVVADTEKSYHYVFDLILRLVFDEKTKERYAVVVKSRLKNAEGKDRFGMGEKLQKWDYTFLTEGMASNVTTRSIQTESEAAEKDKEVVDKDSQSLKISHHIRSHLLPKSGISNEDFELYIANKKLKDGVTPLAVKGEDGKIHLSEIKPENLRWLAQVLENEESRKTLLKRIEELKNQIPGLEIAGVK